MGKPFFSIIIPIYNTEKEYLGCCMDSLINQTFSDIEIILVDDGSKEECGVLCDDYARADGRIRVVHQKNQGVSAARNNGVKSAEAEWIVFVDADDWVERDACERLKRYLEENKCDILQFNAIKEFKNKQEQMYYGFQPNKLYDMSDVDTREFLYKKAMGVAVDGKTRACPCYYSWDKVIRKDFLIENRIEYPIGIAKSEDKVFVLRCYEKLNTLFYVEDILYHYRINAVSVCHKYTENADEDSLRLAGHLMEIAKRMDMEMQERKAELGYDLITQECGRFLFGIITDVFARKYYHNEYPYGKKIRRVQVCEFINKEPYKSAIHKCRYDRMSAGAKLKKFLLSMGWVSLFVGIRKIVSVINGNRLQKLD